MSLLSSYRTDLRAGLSSSLNDIRQAFAGLQDRNARFGAAALALITVIGAVLRISFLWRPLRVDEAWTYILYVSSPFSRALSEYWTNNHLLHTALAKLAVLAFGNHPAVLRLPALIAGILVIPAAYLCFKTLYNSDVGILASALTAAASHQIDYSTEARGYSMVALFFLLMLTLAARLRTQWNPAEALAIGIIGALTITTHLFGLYAVAVVMVWLALSMALDRTINAAAARDGVIALSIMSLLTFLLYLPAILHSGFQALVANEFVVPLTFNEFISLNQTRLLETWDAWTRDLPAWIVWTMAGFAVLAVVFDRKLTSGRAPLVASAVIVCAVLVVIQRIAPYMRLWTFLQPLYLGTAVAGVWLAGSWLRHSMPPVGASSWAMPLAAIGVTLIFGLGVYAGERVRFWDVPSLTRKAPQFADALISLMKPGDAISGNKIVSIPIAYYVESAGFPDTWLSNEFERTWPEGATPRRIFLIIQGEGNNSLQAAHQLLNSLEGITPADYYVPVEVKRLDETYIFVAQHK